MKQSIQSYSGISQMTTRMFDSFTDPVAIVSLDSRYLYMNSASLELCGLRTLKEVLDKYYPEIKSPLFESERAIQQWLEEDQEDQQIVTNPYSELAMLEIHQGAVECPFICRKIPLYNEDHQLVGVVHHSNYLEVYRPNDFIMGKLPGSLLLSKPDNTFTEKECEIIFLKLQGMTSKAIASTLERALSTVENTIQTIYSKAGVNNATDFAEFCAQRKLDRYVPPLFIDPGRISF